MTDASAATKGDATRARILEEATHQASVRGLAAVSLMDVAEAVGLSKSGLFKHFASKEALHLAVLETASERFVQQVWTPAAAQPRGRARMDVLFARWLDWTAGYWRGGCPLMVAARELEQQPGELRDYVVSQLVRLQNTVALTARGLGEDISAEDAAQAAFELNGVMSGYKHGLTLGDPQAKARAMTAYDRVVAGLNASS